jgi:hypothetical protein
VERFTCALGEEEELLLTTKARIVEKYDGHTEDEAESDGILE